MSDHETGAPRRRTASISQRSQVSLLRDERGYIPLMRILEERELLILLSPVVVPLRREAANDSDPFEPFGRALASRHPWVRHVPYTADNGITGYHVAFIRRAKAVIFVISGAPVEGQTSQAEIADIARMVDERQPHIIVACQDARELELAETSFPTVLQLPNYAPEHLEEAAAVLFGQDTHATQDTFMERVTSLRPRKWEVETLPDSLSAYDFTPIVDLWNECFSEQFQMNRYTLSSLLDRAGFAKHYVVRNSATGEIIGFCATYTTWAFSGEDYLLGSLAALVVKPTYRKMGVGRSLHEYATESLTRTRGVRRLQLGSTFPRLLYGIPYELEAHQWFQQRGWQTQGQSPGQGRPVCDWILRIQDWPSGASASAPTGFTFKQCTEEQFPALLHFVQNEAPRTEIMGLFEEYKWSRDYANDIILCINGSSVVATALIYMPHSGTTAEKDLPWARKQGHDVGGITCICIAEENSALQNHRNSVMIRLLGTCVELLQSYGMQHVFLDGVRGGDEGFQDLGFRKWAQYREVWKPT